MSRITDNARKGEHDEKADLKRLRPMVLHCQTVAEQPRGCRTKPSTLGVSRSMDAGRGSELGRGYCSKDNEPRMLVPTVKVA